MNRGAADEFRSESEHDSRDRETATPLDDDRSIADDRADPPWQDGDLRLQLLDSLEEFLPESSTTAAVAMDPAREPQRLAPDRDAKVLEIVPAAPLAATPPPVIRLLRSARRQRQRSSSPLVAAVLVAVMLGGLIAMTWARRIDQARAADTQAAATPREESRPPVSAAPPLPRVPANTAAAVKDIGPQVPTRGTAPQPAAPPKQAVRTVAPAPRKIEAKKTAPTRSALKRSDPQTSRNARVAPRPAESLVKPTIPPVREAPPTELPGRNRTSAAAPLVAAPIAGRELSRPTGAVAPVPPVRPSEPGGRSTPPVAVAAAPPPSAPATADPPPAESRKPAPEPAPAASSAAVDEQNIQNVLARYRGAFNDLSPAAAQLVWPAVNARALERAFDSLEEQVVQFNDCRISVSGDRAKAACAGSTRYVTKVGNRQPRTEPRRWTFNLRKTDQRWLIDTVDTR